MPRISRCPDDLGSHGQGGLVEVDGEVGGLRELVQRSRNAAAGRVAHEADSAFEGEQCLCELEHARGVARQVDLELELAARDHDGHAVVADRPGHEHAVARLNPSGAELDTWCDDADAGRRRRRGRRPCHARRPWCLRPRPTRRRPRRRAPSRRRCGAGLRSGSLPRSRSRPRARAAARRRRRDR